MKNQKFYNKTNSEQALITFCHPRNITNMMNNRRSGFLILVLILHSYINLSAQNKTKLVGGPCQDCEATLDYKLLKFNPRAVDTLPGFIETNPKLRISGTVYHSDGKTPAKDVILYIYHTNRDSIYAPSDNPVGWERRHGQYRGWIKTNAKGEYAFYTFRPTPYPQAQESEHIHIYVKEPGLIPYYIDNYMFYDDPTLKRDDINKQRKRGGSGLIHLNEQDGMLVGHRDLILGLNIPNYDK